jgi:hypothetical protein
MHDRNAYRSLVAPADIPHPSDIPLVKLAVLRVPCQWKSLSGYLVAGIVLRQLVNPFLFCRS